ncbi:hypothetical protein ACKXGF_14405 (plasmid) [Alkalibacillus sp. S2W]|uniref:hypothetical protein n=1 Tax=Alkalibacillus sp. S2W TaxID=3386553 RepID=UPI00398D5E17
MSGIESKKRRSNGVQTRQSYLRSKRLEESFYKVKQLLEKGLKQVEIATELVLSKARVSQPVKELRASSAKEEVNRTPEPDSSTEVIPSMNIITKAKAFLKRKVLCNYSLVHSLEQFIDYPSVSFYLLYLNAIHLYNQEYDFLVLHYQ